MLKSGMSLGKRLTLSFTVVIAFMALLAVLSVMRISALSKEIDLIVSERYPKASIANNINMPLAVNAVSQHIRRQLKNTVGIEAKEVRVVIDKTDLAAKDSPYKASDATMSLSMDKPNDHSRVGSVPGTQTKEGQHGKI